MKPHIKLRWWPADAKGVVVDAGWAAYIVSPALSLGIGPYPTPAEAITAVLRARNAEFERCPMCGSSEWARDQQVGSALGESA